MTAASYPPTVFVLGTDRNIGKTVTCIGIISKLLSPAHGYGIDEIGYIKPVGQQTLTVTGSEGKPIEADKDPVLLASLMGIDCGTFEDMSPVVWRGGLTATFIDDVAQQDPVRGREAYLQRIRDAYAQVARGKRVVIVEGTGQPGVGSVAGISNADVINVLRDMGAEVFVLLVTRGGIGSTIDRLFPYLMALDNLGTRVDGLVINSIIPEKMTKVCHYLQTYYEQIFVPLYGEYLQPAPRIMGFIPELPELKLPTMHLIAETLGQKSDSELEIIAPHDLAGACCLVRKLKVISLEFGYESFLNPGDAVIIGVNANDVILSILLLHERMVRRYGAGLAGMILSCKTVGGLASETRQLVSAGDLATITVNYDSAEIVQRIEGMTVKIQPYDTLKKELIARAYQQNLELWPAMHHVDAQE